MVVQDGPEKIVQSLPCITF